jgi:hypothetical protein
LIEGGLADTQEYDGQHWPGMFTGRQMADPNKGGGGQNSFAHLLVFMGLTVARDSAKEKPIKNKTGFKITE